MEKACVVFLVAFVILSCSSPLHAAHPTEFQGSVAPQFTHISSVVARLSISAWGEASCTGSVTLYSNLHTATLVMELQRFSGSTWTTVQSWTSSGPGFPGVYMNRAHWVVRGTYRLRCIARAFSGSGVLLEEVTVLSHEVGY